MAKRVGKIGKTVYSVKSFLNELDRIAFNADCTKAIVVLANDFHGRAFQFGCDDDDFLRAIEAIAKHSLMKTPMDSLVSVATDLHAVGAINDTELQEIKDAASKTAGTSAPRTNSQR